MEKNKTPFYSPLRYPGGKNCIFSFVSKIFYENGLIGSSYAEPYAGGSGLALRLLCEGYVERIYINDLDKSIYSFWKIVLERPDEFCEWVANVKVSVTNWRRFKAIQGRANDVDEFDLAKSTFFLNRTNVSGVISGGIIGGFRQKGKFKIDARFNKKDLISRIERIATVANRIVLSNDDGVKFINKLNKSKDEIFIYLDPPYYLKGADLYMNFYSKEDHNKLSKYVNRLNKMWMVSYDNHEFILNLYAQHKRVLYQLSQATSNRVGDEIMIFSKNLNFSQALKELKTPILLR
ncbi:MAG: DNA adenine methylase [Cyclobacteriaceae bacterium]|nr:DNA adenine methylase [Cyclobacteriaceae bacterium]